MHTPRVNIRRTAADLQEFMGEGWQEPFLNNLKAMFSRCLCQLLNVHTAEDAMRAAQDLLKSVPPNEVSMIQRNIENMSANGKNIVVLGNFDSPEGHAFFHLVGARMQNVGSAFLFCLPLDRFLAMRKVALGDRINEAQVTQNSVTDFSSRILGQLPPENDAQ